MENQPMAYWHNLSWAVRQSTLNEDGTITAGRIERMEDLAFNYELDKAVVKTKSVQEVQYDLFGNLVKKGNGKKAKVTTVKKQYIEATFKSQNITFKTDYMVDTGTLDILNKIEEIREMIGYSAPLVLGREYYATDPETGETYLAVWPRIWGLFEMQLTKVQVSSTELDEIGRLMKATVKFTLTQTKNAASIAASMTSASDGTKLILQNWVKNGYTYTAVPIPEGEKEKKAYNKQNPKKQGWYELVDGEYVLSSDKKVQSGKTYYTRQINHEMIPDQFWSALSCSPDPNVKALMAQKQADEKKAAKDAKAALKAQVKELNKQIKEGKL